MKEIKSPLRRFVSKKFELQTNTDVPNRVHLFKFFSILLGGVTPSLPLESPLYVLNIGPFFIEHCSFLNICTVNRFFSEFHFLYCVLKNCKTNLLVFSVINEQ